jgi:hypothetical protein
VTERLVAAVFLAFGATWGMPLLFTISGTGVWYSVRSRGPAGFAREGFSLVLLPGLRLLDRAHGQGPAAVLVLAVAIVAVEVLLGSEVGHGGWRRASYALFLVAGFLAAADRRIGQAFRLLKTVDGLLWVVAILGLAGSRRTPVTRALFGLKPHSA